ncbi:glycoside hydrolase family 32 protein [Orbus wheelerorum]|uniref:glycoside hydrolase family 32 protein n=1 Tax=Orbus wheelerorum TaxID=3074111 RepID=UPI00370DC7F4
MKDLLIEQAEQYIVEHQKDVKKRWYPTFHLAPRIGWMNDPNGLVWFKGYYHAFYQHHPYSAFWGPMHWGHARSKDLIHWEELPIALAPSGEEDKDGCFSGSAVVDGETLVLIYTGHKFHGEKIDDNLYQVQCLAVSKDGVNFERQGMIIDTPVGINHFRDPKVWKEKDSWYMVVGARVGDIGEVRLYKSADLRHWCDAGIIGKADKSMGYMWECPDFFPLNDKYVLMFSPQGLKAEGYHNRNLFQSGYLTGTWHPNSKFIIEKPFKELDLGTDFYAPQSFVAPDGRRIVIAWLDMWESAMPEREDNWAGMLTLPRELTITDDGLIQMNPIKEILKLRSKFTPFINLIEINNEIDVVSSCKIAEIVLNINLKNSTAEKYGFKFGTGINVFIDNQAKRLVIEREYSQYQLFGTRSVELPESDQISLRIFIDMSSIEIFVNNGYACLSSRMYPELNERNIKLYAYGGQADISGSGIWTLVI